MARVRRRLGAVVALLAAAAEGIGPERHEFAVVELEAHGRLAAAGERVGERDFGVALADDVDLARSAAWCRCRCSARRRRRTPAGRCLRRSPCASRRARGGSGWGGSRRRRSTVKPFACTTASAALSPSALSPMSRRRCPPVGERRRGRGARRARPRGATAFARGVVVVVLVGVVEVVVVVVLVRGVPVEVVPSGSGVLASTVFVPPPQPASSAASATPRRGGGIVGKRRLMASMIFAARSRSSSAWDPSCPIRP